MLNKVVGVNTGNRVPRLVFPVLFRSPFGRMALASALAIPTGMRAFEAWDWNAQDLSALDMPVTFLIGSQSPPFNRRFADTITARIPHATIEVIGGGSHGTPMEQPDRFACDRLTVTSPGLPLAARSGCAGRSGSGTGSGGDIPLTGHMSPPGHRAAGDRLAEVTPGAWRAVSRAPS